MDEESWYASLATMYGSAAALITDTDDPSARVLLVKPNYRDLWSLPGGILEDGEAPHRAASVRSRRNWACRCRPGRCSPWRGARPMACGRGRS